METAIIEVLAEFELFDGSVSGKTVGYKSGVRPNHFFPGQTSSIIGVVLFENQEWLPLGSSCKAVVRFLYPNTFPVLSLGSTWRVYEGGKHVGNGRVLEVKR